MGTRNLTCVAIDGEIRVAQYGQWDGYPSVGGVECLNFLRTFDKEKFSNKVRASKFIGDDDLKNLYISYDINFDRFRADYPQLDRSIGRDVLKLIETSQDGILLGNSIDFAKDSLFCEWAYVIDLDNGVLEVYSGFNESPLDESERFYSQDPDENGYYPIKLLEKFDINNLPTDEEFIKICDPEED